MYVDSMKLAYWVFIAFRSGGRPDRQLEILIDALEAVEQQGILVVKMPDDADEILKPFYRISSEAAKIAAPLFALPSPLEYMPAENRALIPYMKVAAQEFKRLRKAGLGRALKSLGYTMHVIPEVIDRREEFDADWFQCNVRVAAAHWPDYSAEMRAAMAKVLGVEPARLDEMARQEGFALEWF